MKRAKYVVYADCIEYESDSRNARKHLLDTGCGLVIVCKPDEKTEISRACRLFNGMILHGASRG